MTYPDHIERFGAPSSSVGLIYSTKDRCDLTEQTWPRVAGQVGGSPGDYDLYWLDGSTSEEGRALPLAAGRQADNLVEAHLGVTGGPDVAIVYGLTHLLQRGYDHIGLIENDVLLEPGWFETVMGLFDAGRADELDVGAATVRTFDRRILWQRRSYAVLFGSGAGMIVFTAEAARRILRHYRTTTVDEIRRTFQLVAERDIALTWEMADDLVRTSDSFRNSADWYWDAALAKTGQWILGSVPSLGANIDADLKAMLGIEPIGSVTETHDGNLDFGSWLARVTKPGYGSETVIGLDATYQLEPRHRHWVVYPHQLAATVPEAFDDGWSLEARQTSGPFTFRARRAGATLRLPVNGPGRVVLAPQARSDQGVELHHHHHFSSHQDRAVRYSDHTALADRMVRHFDVRRLESRVVELVADEAGLGVEAVIFEESQPWMYRRSDFSFETLRRFL